MFISVLLFLLLSSSILRAEELVPESTSPDGQFAICYGPPHSFPDDRTPQVWIVNLRTHHHVSAQLAPSDEMIYRLVRIRGVETMVYRNESTGVYADDRQMLWTTLVDGIEARQRGEGTAINTSIIWGNRSQRVDVQVGIHKFVHTSVYQLRRGRFYRVKDFCE